MGAHDPEQRLNCYAMSSHKIALILCQRRTEAGQRGKIQNRRLLHNHSLLLYKYVAILQKISCVVKKQLPEKHTFVKMHGFFAKLGRFFGHN